MRLFLPQEQLCLTAVDNGGVCSVLINYDCAHVVSF